MYVHGVYACLCLLEKFVVAGFSPGLSTSWRYLPSIFIRYGMCTRVRACMCACVCTDMYIWAHLLHLVFSMRRAPHFYITNTKYICTYAYSVHTVCVCLWVYVAERIHTQYMSPWLSHMLCVVCIRTCRFSNPWSRRNLVWPARWWNTWGRSRRWCWSSLRGSQAHHCLMRLMLGKSPLTMRYVRMYAVLYVYVCHPYVQYYIMILYLGMTSSTGEMSIEEWMNEWMYVILT